MKSFIFAAAAFAAPGLVQGQGGQENICGDAALTKCQNGLFNQELCACDCIPPYCPDLIGDCTNPSNKCDNPWTECEKGVDCPWWNNLLTLESCATGWEVRLMVVFASAHTSSFVAHNFHSKTQFIYRSYAMILS